MNRKFSIAALFLIALSIPFFKVNSFAAQTSKDSENGFFVSMSAGPLFGSVENKICGSLVGIGEPKSIIETYSGIGQLIDLKIGGRIASNLYLHSTGLIGILPSPKFSSSEGGLSKELPVDVSLNEAMFGLGLTYYIQPYDIFVSGSIGRGIFAQLNRENSIHRAGIAQFTDFGTSYQIKVGKEWQASERWGLGAALGYYHTSAILWTSGRFSLQFSATFK